MNFIFILSILITSIIVKAQTNDTIFIYLENKPYEEFIKNKYFSGEKLSTIHLGRLSKTSIENYDYFIDFSSSFLNDDCNLQPYLIEDKEYRDLKKDDWISQKTVDSWTIKEFIDFFKQNSGKTFLILNKYYLEKFPDISIIFKSENNGVNIPIQ